MADPVLSTGQYSIGVSGGPAFTYGGRSGSYANNIQVATTQTDSGNLAVQDQAVVGHDGMLFGIDTMEGMAVTQSGQVNMPGQGAAAMDMYGTLAANWNDPAIRLANSKIVVLRAFYPGSAVVRRCYGRGRKIVPVMGLVNQGLVPWTAMFQAADGIWYSDVDNGVTLTKTASRRGGVPPPWGAPMLLAPASDATLNSVNNTGPQPTWPVITFTGNISNPGITYIDTPVSIGYRGSIGISDTLVIDTRPWARTALLNGVSVAGRLTGDPMISLQLQPGTTRISFTGQDYAGSSTVTVRWRSAFLSIGGNAL